MRLLLKLSNSIVYGLFIGLIVLVTHGGLVSSGYFIHDSDAFLPLLWVEELRSLGHWSPNLFQTGYGGTILSELRLLWVVLISPWIKHDQSHFIFSFLILPWLVALLSAWATSGWANATSSRWVGVWVAFGFPSWTYLFGFDHYLSILVFGFIWLGLRGRIGNPWKLPRHLLLSCAILGGVSLYSSRANALGLALFWIPPQFFQALFEQFKKSNSHLRWLSGSLVVFMIGLHFWVTIYGPEIGIGFNRVLRIHREAHFQSLLIVLIGFGIYFGRTCLRDSVSLGRLGHLILGIGIGMSPEWLGWLITGVHPRAGMILSGPEEVLSIIAKVPTFLREMAWGEDHLNFVSEHTQSGFEFFGWFFSICFLLSGVAIFLRKNSWSFLGLGLILPFIAIFQIVLTGAGETRYLFPIYPVLAVGYGLWLDRVSGLGKIVSIGLLIASGLYSVSYHFALATQGLKRDDLAQIQKVVEMVRDLHAEVVITDSYWASHSYSFYSRGKPYFTGDGAEWGPVRARELALSAKPSFLLFTGRKDPGLNSTYSTLGRRWKVHQKYRDDKFSIYQGDEIE